MFAPVEQFRSPEPDAIAFRLIGPPDFHDKALRRKPLGEW
jgi:hypothetical protein